MTETMVRLDEVEKLYGAVRALWPTSLEVRKGEFVTLLGPSGSGKTTILNLISGSINASSGAIWIGDRDVTRLPPNRRELGMVFQNYALMPHMNVFENIAFPLRVRKRPEAEIRRKVDEVLDVVRLAGYGDRKPKELSGGQQQRIAIARCLVYDPDLILMDEPLGALDKKLRDQMQLEIKALQRRLGITVVYVTHDQEEAMTMSDRICLMNHAKIEQIDTPETLYFRPRTVFAADFLGDSNIFKARLAAGRLEGPGGLVVNGLRNGAGGPVTAIIRPESLRVLSNGEAAEGGAAGTLENVVFVGGFMRLFVRLPDGTILQAKGATAPGLKLPPPGDAVRLGWPAAATVLIPEGGAA
jgi:putative spermidine/putrescine transport system ATP-binding protein